MNKKTNQLLKLLTVLVLANMMCQHVLASQTYRIRMQDGAIWRGEANALVEIEYTFHRGKMNLKGELKKVTDQYIVVLKSDGSSKTLFRKDLIKITTLGQGDTRADTGPIDNDTPPNLDIAMDSKPSVKPLGNRPDASLPHVFLLPLEGTVGGLFRVDEIKAIGEEADKYGPGQIIVFVIDSGGGSMNETEQIHKTMTEIAKRHRLVAWIKHATSAACATAIHCSELYFMTEGRAGAMTAWHGAGESVQGAAMQDWLRRAGQWMEQERSDRSAYIAHAMIDQTKELSYDKNPVTGEVTWYNTTQGEFVLSRQGENLEFNVSNALHSGFAQGKADTTDELAKLLHLPIWYETNSYGRDIAAKWKRTFERGEREVPLILAKLSIENQRGDPEVVIGTQIKYLKQLISWWRRAPNVMESIGLMGPEDLQKEITELRRQLARRNR
ncbi:MAG: hypothetical protein O7G85_03250 [Planctomycetota bacterium]|nr:hypothetical protein [Planctomycetota bacterium]